MSKSTTSTCDRCVSYSLGSSAKFLHEKMGPKEISIVEKITGLNQICEMLMRG